LENLDDDDDDADINRAWGSTGENKRASTAESLGYYELKENKPWFDEEYSELLDQRRQANYSGCKNLS
jgi:hypothetical protein